MIIDDYQKIDEYLDYFNKLPDSQKLSEIDFWVEKIKNESHNKYELMTFLKLSDIMGVDFDDKNETNQNISEIMSDLDNLSDYVLEHYEGTDRQKKLLDDINLTKEECQIMIQFLKEKIIN